MELAENIYFPKGAASPYPQSRPELKGMTLDIRESIADIDEVRVIGHADPIPFKGKPESNNALALQRACQVAAYLKQNAYGDKYRIAVESRGAREPKTLCKDWPVKESIGECFAINRRVDIRVKYKEAAATRPPTKLDLLGKPLPQGENVVQPPKDERTTGRLPRIDGIDSFERMCTHAELR